MSESLARDVEVSPALGRQINEACNRFEAAWRSGAAPRLEDFVVGWEGSERLALLREVVPLDADYRRARGESATPDDYRARFPELGDDWLEANVGCAAGCCPDAGARLLRTPCPRTSVATASRKCSAKAGSASSTSPTTSSCSGSSPSRCRIASWWIAPKPPKPT